MAQLGLNMQLFYKNKIGSAYHRTAVPDCNLSCINVAASCLCSAEYGCDMAASVFRYQTYST